jgi:hypothetical protein
MSRCVRSCGRKAKPKSRLCQQCEDRTRTRELDSGRYPKRNDKRHQWKRR